MAEQKESSVLFSLKELMSLEEDRIKDEEASKERQVQMQLQARDVEQRARDAEQARMNAEQERMRHEEQRRREEDARLDAIRQGEVEKARMDAENRGRMEAMQKQQSHDLQIAALNQDKKKKSLTYALAGGGVLFLLVLGGGAYAVNAMNTKAAAEAKRHQEELQESDKKVAALQATLTSQQAEVDRLNGAVANAKTDGEREAARKALEAAKSTAAKTSAALGGVRTGGGGAVAPAGGGPKKPACNCVQGDPLCSCL
jgi:colicin import membrane protein